MQCISASALSDISPNMQAVQSLDSRHVGPVIEKSGQEQLEDLTDLQKVLRKLVQKRDSQLFASVCCHFSLEPCRILVSYLVPILLVLIVKSDGDLEYVHGRQAQDFTKPMSEALDIQYFICSWRHELWSPALHLRLSTMGASRNLHRLCCFQPPFAGAGLHLSQMDLFLVRLLLCELLLQCLLFGALLLNLHWSSFFLGTVLTRKSIQSR